MDPEAEFASETIQLVFVDEDGECEAEAREDLSGEINPRTITCSLPDASEHEVQFMIQTPEVADLHWQVLVYENSVDETPLG